MYFLPTEALIEILGLNTSKYDGKTSSSVFLMGHKLTREYVCSSKQEPSSERACWAQNGMYNDKSKNKIMENIPTIKKQGTRNNKKIIGYKAQSICSNVLQLVAGT